MVMRERECVRVSQADSADREGLSKWAIFMLLITKATVETPLPTPLHIVWECTLVWLRVDGTGIHLSSPALPG